MLDLVRPLARLIRNQYQLVIVRSSHLFHFSIFVLVVASREKIRGRSACCAAVASRPSRHSAVCAARRGAADDRARRPRRHSRLYAVPTADYPPPLSAHSQLFESRLYTSSGVASRPNDVSMSQSPVAAPVPRRPSPPYLTSEYYTTCPRPFPYPYPYPSPRCATKTRYKSAKIPSIIHPPLAKPLSTST